MSTFLQLCKSYCREAGISGGESAITTVASQTGELGRCVSNISQAWRDIQARPQYSGMHWRWMRSQFTLTTVSGTGQYAYGNAAIIDDEDTVAISRFRKWMIKDEENPPKSYLQASGVGTEGYLTYCDWNDFKSLFRLGTQNDSQPQYVSIDPQNRIVLGPAPNDIYIVTGDYIKGAQILTADGDTPDMPSDYHDLIVHEALIKYGLFESAPEVITSAQHFASQLLSGLEGDQLSEIMAAGAMA